MTGFALEILGIPLAGAAWWIEARTGRIPNALTLPALLLGIALGTLAAPAWHLSGLLLAFPGVVLYGYSCLGGGGFKLLLAAGVLGGPVAPLAAYLLTVLLFAWQALRYARYRAAPPAPFSPVVLLSAGGAVAFRFLYLS